METVVDLRKPVKGNWEGRGYGRHYVWTYRCTAGHTIRMNCSTWSGKNPALPVGGFRCPQCEPLLIVA